MVLLQALGQIGDVLNWLNTLGVIVLIVTFFRTSRRDSVSDVDKKIREKTDILEKDIEKLKTEKANKEWVISEVKQIDSVKEHVATLVNDIKEEIKTQYDSIEKNIKQGNEHNKSMLYRIEEKYDAEILINKEFRKKVTDLDKEFAVMKNRL